jgi:type VI secretion system protein ImpL
MGLGLYQGDKLGSQAASPTAGCCHRTLLPRVMLRLEDQIRQGTADPDRLYDALRIYLMLDDPDRYDPEAVQLWVTRDWERNLPRETTKEQHAALPGTWPPCSRSRPAPLPLALDGRLIAGRPRHPQRPAPGGPDLCPSATETGIGDDVPDFTIADCGRRVSPPWC